ncbi:MAG: hypothetical protein ACRC62_10125, partial [Microcoleus sp.]
LSKRTEELISRLQTTLALRQGFKPLPDYLLYVKLTRMGSAVSLQKLFERRVYSIDLQSALTVNCQLSIVNYQLSTVNCQLLTNY